MPMSFCICLEKMLRKTKAKLEIIAAAKPAQAKFTSVALTTWHGGVLRRAGHGQDKNRANGRSSQLALKRTGEREHAAEKRQHRLDAGLARARTDHAYIHAAERLQAIISRTHRHAGDDWDEREPDAGSVALPACFAQ